MTAVTQLGWLRNGEYAPIMMAEAKGFFKDEGIDHKIVDGGPGKNPIPIVAVGQAQFGLATNGMTVVTARLAKDPVDVVAVGTLFQQAPTSYLTITAPDAPPAKPKDMEGKTVGTQVGTEFLFAAFARKSGIDASKVKVVAGAGDGRAADGRQDGLLPGLDRQPDLRRSSRRPPRPTRRRP